jgi:hypothetical protein
MTDFGPEYFDRKFDDLEGSIRLALTISPAHLRNAFTGLNVRKRRCHVLMRDFADWFAKYLCKTYLFYRNDTVISEAEMSRFLLAWFHQVPDAEGKACWAKSILVSDPARNKIAADLHAEITNSWRSIYSPSHLRPRKGGDD